MIEEQEQGLAHLDQALETQEARLLDAEEERRREMRERALMLVEDKLSRIAAVFEAMQHVPARVGQQGRRKVGEGENETDRPPHLRALCYHN
jgi:hypothetical protein